jgi:hypothetical protein
MGDILSLENVITLDKKTIKFFGCNIKESTLRGRLFNFESNNGFTDSFEAIIKENLLPAPTYLLIKHRIHTDFKDASWEKFYDTYAERITVLDEKGIIGTKGELYVLDIQNGGLFTWNTQRIRRAINDNQSIDYGLQLTQDEIDLVLSAMQKKDYASLTELVHGQQVTFSGNYDEFLEASAGPKFIDGMKTTYLVLRPTEEARKIFSKYREVDLQRDDPNTIIASGGKANAEVFLDYLKKEYPKFNSKHDKYLSKNVGHSLVLMVWNGGVNDYYCGQYGRFVGVAQNDLKQFYR